jgi:hypothetical protein
VIGASLAKPQPRENARACIICLTTQEQNRNITHIDRSGAPFRTRRCIREAAMFAVMISAMVCAVLITALLAMTASLAFRQRRQIWAALTYDEMAAVVRAPRVVPVNRRSATVLPLARPCLPLACAA